MSVANTLRSLLTARADPFGLLHNSLSALLFIPTKKNVFLNKLSFFPKSSKPIAFFSYDDYENKSWSLQIERGW